jgi:hypothetical protein
MSDVALVHWFGAFAIVYLIGLAVYWERRARKAEHRLRYTLDESNVIIRKPI